MLANVGVPPYIHPPEIAYDWMIVTYFFLGGLSAGLFLFSVVANYWKQELRPMAKIPALAAPVVLSVGLLVLLLHLGQPFRFPLLFIHFNPTSVLSWGAWLVNVFFVLSVIYGWHVLKGRPEKGKTVAMIGIPFAVAAAAYTGILLTQAPGRILWHSALVPVLFINGALISGLAVALLPSATAVAGELRAKVGKALAGLLALEVVLAVIELLVLANAGTEGVAMAAGLLSGGFGFLFLGLVVILGSLIPAGLLLKSKGSVAVQTIAAVLILIGVFTMRFVVVVGGQVIH